MTNSIYKQFTAEGILKPKQGRVLYWAKANRECPSSFSFVLKPVLLLKNRVYYDNLGTHFSDL